MYKFSFVSLLGILAASTAAADPADDDIDNILVTASRTPLARVEAGNAVTVITRDQIERRQARYVTDMLRAVPGFSVSQLGNNGSQTQVRVRGAEANHVLVLIDGIRANDPASGDEFRWEFLSTSNVERIEIVRGPQSSLWGSDAVAAVVNVITRSGEGSPAIGGYVEGGSYSTANAGFQGGAGSEDWSVAYGLERLDTDGTNISRSGDETDGSGLTTATLSARLRATNRVSFDGGLRYTGADSQYDPTDFVTTGLPVDGDRSTDAAQLFAQLGATVAGLDGRWQNHLRARFLDADSTNRVDGIDDNSTASQRLTLGYQGDMHLGDNVLSLAYEHEVTDFSQRGEVGFGDPNQDQRLTVNSIVADFQGRSLERWTWLVSARYDDYSAFENALTGRLAGAWDVTDSTTLRASVGTGQKIPTFSERYGFFADSFLGNPALKPEKSTSYELGIDQRLLDDRLALQVTFFHQDLEDEINGFVFDPDSFLFTAENQQGRSKRSGVELDANIRLGDQLAFGAMYTFTDAEQDDGAGNTTAELRRPKHTGSLNASYLFLNERGSLLLVADYGGTQQDTWFPPFPEPSETITLASYWLLDATVGFDLTDSVNLFLRGSNLLDERYENVYGYATAGRAGYLGLRVDFGQ